MIASALALLLNPADIIVVATLLGLLVGSFLNVVIYRLGRMLESECLDPQQHTAEQTAEPPLSLSTPASHCPNCKRPIRPLENIPVLSYLMLRGRCAGCRVRIPLRYPLVELGSALLASTAAWHFGPTLQLVGALLLLWTLTALLFIDIDHQILPDDLTQPLLWMGLILNSLGIFVPLRDAVWGAVAGYMALWSIFWIFRLMTGKDGMGYGDFKLLAALGAWLGWTPLLPIIVLASTMAALVGLLQMRLRGPEHGRVMAFGPYLAAAGMVALFFEVGGWVGIKNSPSVITTSGLPFWLVEIDLRAISGGLLA